MIAPVYANDVRVKDDGQAITIFYYYTWTERVEGEVGYSTVDHKDLVARVVLSREMWTRFCAQASSNLGANATQGRDREADEPGAVANPGDGGAGEQGGRGP